MGFIYSDLKSDLMSLAIAERLLSVIAGRFSSTSFLRIIGREMLCFGGGFDISVDADSSGFIFSFGIEDIIFVAESWFLFKERRKEKSFFGDFFRGEDFLSGF